MQYKSSEINRKSMKLLNEALHSTVTIACADGDETFSVFNRLNVARFRMGDKLLNIGFDRKTSIVTIRVKRPTMLAAAPVEAYQHIADVTGKPAEHYRQFAEDTAAAINAQGGLEEANGSARPWSEIKEELGIVDPMPESTTIAVSKREVSAKQDKSGVETIRDEDYGTQTLNLAVGLKLRQRGKCFHCGSDLASEHCHTLRFVQSMTRAFAVDICCACVSCPKG